MSMTKSQQDPQISKHLHTNSFTNKDNPVVTLFIILLQGIVAQ